MSINRDRRRPASNTPQKAAASEYAQDSLLAPTAGGTRWTVEAEHRDGGGLRSWFVVRRGDQVRYCADRRELAAYLDQHGVAPDDLATLAEDLLPPGEDGCE